MWSRRLEIAELRSLWVSGCAKHGLPPPPEWVDWRAAPAAGIVRVIGTAADALTGAVLEYVRVCAVKRGDGHPLSGAVLPMARSGALAPQQQAKEPRQLRRRAQPCRAGGAVVHGGGGGFRPCLDRV